MPAVMFTIVGGWGSGNPPVSLPEMIPKDGAMSLAAIQKIPGLSAGI